MKSRLKVKAGHVRHEHLVALHAEPHGKNPPKLIGYVCPTCLVLLTAKHQWSQPMVPSIASLPNSTPRRSQAHAARIRAAERLRFTIREEQAA